MKRVRPLSAQPVVLAPVDNGAESGLRPQARDALLRLHRRVRNRGDEFEVYAHGEHLTLRTVPGVEPTPFSMFIANIVMPNSGDNFAIDAGAGGGILAIMLARLGVQSVVGVECSELACEVFRENVRRNGVAGQVEIVHGDIADYEPSRPADLVVANPPTLPEHEDLPTFVRGGGADGMAFLRVLLAHSVQWLYPHGSLQFVVSSVVDPNKLDELVIGHRWRLSARGNEPVPLRSFYGAAYGTRSDGSLLLPGEPTAGRLCNDNQEEIITVYHAHQQHRGGTTWPKAHATANVEEGRLFRRPLTPGRRGGRRHGA